MKTHYDIIIVGGGSAGCALAHRLALNSDLEILLLEAGSPAYNPLLHIPLGFAFLMKKHRNNWSYQTQPEPGLMQRSIDLPRGKVLGGCSAINGMVHVRGQAADFDRWAELGNKGWSYEDVLPYFKRSEDCENGPDAYHGEGGPLWVGNVKNDFPVCDAFIEAAQQAGHTRNNDINGASQEGVGYFPTNIKQGRRLSSASAFLTPVKNKKNLTVITSAITSRVVFEHRRAVAVDCKVKGERLRFSAGKEIVLCGGAINSPKLLELSGIGQAERLQQQGIEVVQHLPGVGENLQDHWNIYLVRRTDRGSHYYSESKAWPMLKNIARYVFSRRGFLANPAALVAVFYRAQAQAERADAQIHFAPAASTTNARGNMQPLPGILASACGLRPSSRGSSHIHSSNSEQSPKILVNYLQTQQDQTVAVEAFKKVREIFSQPALQAYGGEELQPGADIDSDAEILDYIRQQGEPVHHLVGTCKMGCDEQAVVDDQLRVHGVQGLRVADASIMPEIVSGNTHATCVMIAEKAADLILNP